MHPRSTVRSHRYTCPTGSGRAGRSQGTDLVQCGPAGWQPGLGRPNERQPKAGIVQTLVRCGFKEIEVGFPSASNTEFDFNRRLIEDQRAPEDVWLQVLVQAREDLIERTFESLAGAKRAIIHLYNSTSPAQRRVVFDMSGDEIIKLAVRGATLIQERLPQLKNTEFMLQYSPESFSATEVEFARTSRKR